MKLSTNICYENVIISCIFCSNYPYIDKVFDIGKVVVVSDFKYIHQNTQIHMQQYHGLAVEYATTEFLKLR
jgi:hypothetical protein